MSQLIEILSHTIHASVQAVLPDYALRMPPYTQEDRVTFSGQRKVSIMSPVLSLSLRSTAALGKVFVLLAVSFVGVHAQTTSEQMSPVFPMSTMHSAASSSSLLSSISAEPILMTRMTREQRIEVRKKAAADRTALRPPAPERLAPRALNQRGVYLTAGSVARTQFFDDTIDDVKAARGSAVIFDVKGGGVLYRSGAPMATELGLVRSIYDLPAVIEKLHAQGFEVIGRFVAIKDEALTMKRPDLRMKHPVTGRTLTQNWVDPANDEVITFNMQVMCELAAAGMDEINIDYIRNSGADETLHSLTGKEKADRLEKFILAARDTINRCGPKTRLGLSTYAILGWSYDINVETLGQDVRRFAPLVDVISPMAYPATFAPGYYYVPGKHPRSRMYYLVYRTLTGYKELLGPEHSWKIRPWIQGYGITTRDMTEQMDAVFDAGSCGFLVWNANNNYAPTYAAMTADTSHPEGCGITIAQH